MTVLIDPPLWPAHGTFFSHLVSDASVEELQAFARDAGLPERAFDRDHYDVPLRERELLIALGAVEVSAGELTRRLIAGGVRVPARERPDRHDGWLRRRFDLLLPGRDELRESLLGRWAEPGRHYHDKRHLAEVLRTVDWLASTELRHDSVGRETAAAAELAGWWHDAVYEGQAGRDEARSAALAEADLLGSVGPDQRRRVAAIILMTTQHHPGDDPAQALLSDADLRVLARPLASYERYVADVRRDYAHVSDADFRRGRAQVLAGLLSTHRLYATATAHAAWESTARANLEGELRRLERGTV